MQGGSTLKMIIMRVHGGLGNQLFEYATAYALSKRLKQPFQLDFTSGDDRPFRLNHLNIPIFVIKDFEQLPQEVNVIKNYYVNKALINLNITSHQFGKFLYLKEIGDIFLKDVLAVDADNIYLEGCFQSELFFRDYKADLQKQYTPTYVAEQKYIQTLEEIRGCNAVAVHVRRGDFKVSAHPFHYLLNEIYYKRAISYIRERINSPVFFWFSDEHEWVRERFKEESGFRFVNVKTKNGDIDDMMLMKHCQHIITANSTFSWWAAWLNEHEEAIRIVPEKQYGIKEMIPDSWIKLPID